MSCSPASLKLFGFLEATQRSMIGGRSMATTGGGRY